MVPLFDADDPTWDAAMQESYWTTTLDESLPVLEADPATLTQSGALDFLIEVQRAQARLAALEARAMVTLAGVYRYTTDVDVIDEFNGDASRITISDAMREEIAAALHRSPTAVHDQLVTARLLAGPLSRTLDSLAEGRLSHQHARAIADQARRLSNSHPTCHQDPADDSAADASEREAFIADCTLLQDRVLRKAERTTVGKTRALARAAVSAIDVAGQERRREQARATINVHLYPDDDGLAVLLARLPMEHAARAYAALDARARTTQADCGATLGQLRVTALVDALCGTEPAATVTTEVQVVIEATALLGLLDIPGTMSVGTGEPQPISAKAVRALVDDPDLPTALRRLITDPATGHPLDRGRTTYRVTDAMRAFLATRDGTCRHPGCTRPAGRCQVDHAVAWSAGGGTDIANTGSLCTRHHQLKTHAAWRILQSRSDGSATWRSPLGRTYTVDPLPVLATRPPPGPKRASDHDPPPF